MVISFRISYPCTSRQQMAMRIGGMKNEESEKWKREIKRGKRNRKQRRRDAAHFTLDFSKKKL